MRRFIEEFPVVLASSRKTELSICVAGLFPPVILLVGVMVAGRIEFPGLSPRWQFPSAKAFCLPLGPWPQLRSSNWRRLRSATIARRETGYSNSAPTQMSH